MSVYRRAHFKHASQVDLNGIQSLTLRFMDRHGIGQCQRHLIPYSMDLAFCVLDCIESRSDQQLAVELTRGLRTWKVHGREQ